MFHFRICTGRPIDRLRNVNVLIFGTFNVFDSIQGIWMYIYGLDNRTLII